MLASHSTDLQQRAYELQAILGLDAHAVMKIMPVDSTCEDIEIDKNLSFLDGYVQQSLENGAQPYIPDSERSVMYNINNFKNQEDLESSTHALRFEAYEIPKPSLPPVVATSTELVPVPELSYVADILQPSTSITSASSSDAGSSDLKLRLDGVQRKWGRPNYSTPEPPKSSNNTVKIQNEATLHDSVGISNSKAREVLSYDSRKQQVEIPPEKQKLAASLFGGASKSERRHSSSSQKTSKTQNHTADKSHVAVKTSQPPPPDLMDLGEPSSNISAPSIDPFKQLEGLLDLTQDTTSLSTGGVGATEAPDFSSLFADMSLSAQSDDFANQVSNVNSSNGLGGSTTERSIQQQLNKGPNLKEALEKDALVRQLGVTPSGQNPNLFKDLLG
ncbi:hypothetical protein ACJIZ3_001792 [Penstemon smallii]|uniref:Uncharacterized protein n=1 Tax=Penstemon smallii TaxID=265156 RepID=A0ABD3U4K8_9LAMI